MFTAPTTMQSSIRRVAAINEVFIDKGWDLKEDDSKHAFNSCCEIAGSLNSDEFSLFLILLGGFIRIRFEAYAAMLDRAFASVDIGFDGASVRAAPVIAPEDEGKNKSGVTLLYPFEHLVWKKSPKTKGVKLLGSVSPYTLKKEKGDCDRVCSIFLDDFIGTGDTAEKFLERYNSEIRGEGEEVIFVCIAAMESGIRKLNDMGYKVFCDTIVPRGISDNSKISDKVIALEAMRAIEKNIKVSRKYRFGYRRSEALISLARTPNNTFPLFWEAVSERFCGGPFPRHRHEP